MAFSDGDLAAIDAAIATGTLSVEYADRKVTYRSVQELERARQLIRADLAQSAGVQLVRPYFCRGR